MLIEQKQTAISSYSLSKGEGLISAINERVLNYIQQREPCTRNEITFELKLTDRQVGCACSHLLKDSKIFVFDKNGKGKRNRNIETLAFNRNPQLVFPKKSNAEKLKEIKEYLEENVNEESWAEDILAIINS